MQVVFTIWMFKWKTGNVATLWLSVSWCDLANFLPDFYNSWWVFCRLSVLAAGSSGQDSWDGSILLVFSNDTISQPDDRLNVTLQVLHVRGDAPRFVLYLLDNTLTNPAHVWLHAGAPVFPEQQLRAQLRAVEVKHA